MTSSFLKSVTTEVGQYLKIFDHAILANQTTCFVNWTAFFDRKGTFYELKAEKVSAENIEDACEIIIVSGFKTKKVPPLMWRECIKKIWEIDPLLCKLCGGTMKIISVSEYIDVTWY